MTDEQRGHAAGTAGRGGPNLSGMAGWFAPIEVEPLNGAASEFDARVVTRLATWGPAQELKSASAASAGDSAVASLTNGVVESGGTEALSFFIPETLLLRPSATRRPVAGPAAPSPRVPSDRGSARKTWVPTEEAAPGPERAVPSAGTGSSEAEAEPRRARAEPVGSPPGAPSEIADRATPHAPRNLDPVAAEPRPAPTDVVAPVEDSATEVTEVADLEVVEEEVAAEDVVEVAADEVRPLAGEGSLPPPAPSEANEKRRTWFLDTFNDDYLALSEGDRHEAARLDARFLDGRLGLSRGNHVLDIGCGDGRHCLALAERGYNVTGVDLSYDLLDVAKSLNRSREEPVRFIEQDMRKLKLDRRFDAIVCLGSTFGYFDDETNRICLERMRDALEPGGKLALQVFNRDFVVSRLPCRSWWRGQACLVLDEVDLDESGERMTNHRTIVFEDGRQTEQHISIRAYCAHELTRLVHAAGMRVTEISGGRAVEEIFFPACAQDIWLFATR